MAGGRGLFKSLYFKNRLDKKIFKQGKKGININSIKINKISELIGIFNVVMFSPEDLKIVKESPAFRRKFLDMELCQINNSYYYNLVQYNKILFERNTVLKKWNKNLDMLDIYDIQLSKYGSFIIKERIKYIKELNKKGSKIHKDITTGNENIEFKYLTSLKKLDSLEKELYNLITLNREKDILRNTTTIGPHREDFIININGIDAKSFGSQGQQRTAVLTIKFASLDIIKEKTGEYPVLLLDDVLSELDISRQEYILNSINNFQTIITGTGIININHYLNKNVKVYNVKNGIIKETIL